MNAPKNGVTGDLKPPALADYVDEGEIARGGQGEIRKVVDTNLLRTLAMKILDPRLAGQEIHRKRFVEEAQITAQLDHPNIPPVHRIGMDNDGRLFFTMKRLTGTTLEDLLTQQPHRGDWTRLSSFLQTFVTVCNAVAFANARGVVHRDLKPDNIMVADHGQVYVVDWGIARILGHARPSGQDKLPPVRVWGAAADESGTVAGTPEYMAPEQAEGRIDAIDERTDVFALGAVLYRILVGRAPYEAGSPIASLTKAVTVDFEHPLVAAPHRVPEALCEVVTRAMSRDRAVRYPTVDALREDVEAFMRGPSHLPTRHFAAGSTIIREGDIADAAYVITRGRACVYKMVAGTPVVMNEMGPGYAFGEAAILSSQPRTASVQALEPVTALMVTREALEKELGEATMLAPLVRQLASRFREVDSQLSEQRLALASNTTARAVFLYVAMHGISVAPGRKAVSWTPLRDYLCATLSCSPDAATASISLVPEAELSLANDALHVVMVRHAR